MVTFTCIMGLVRERYHFPLETTGKFLHLVFLLKANVNDASSLL